jgi:hypothetical protein
VYGGDGAAEAAAEAGPGYTTLTAPASVTL